MEEALPTVAACYPGHSVRVEGFCSAFAAHYIPRQQFTKIKIAGASTEVSIDEILQSELKKKKKKRKDSKIFMPPYPTTM